MEILISPDSMKPIIFYFARCMAHIPFDSFILLRLHLQNDNSVVPFAINVYEEWKHQCDLTMTSTDMLN